MTWEEVSKMKERVSFVVLASRKEQDFKHPISQVARVYQEGVGSRSAVVPEVFAGDAMF